MFLLYEQIIETQIFLEALLRISQQKTNLNIAIKIY